MDDQEIIDKRQSNDDLANWGWWLIFLLPIAGVVVGVVLMYREDPRGQRITVGSLAFGVLLALIYSQLM